MADPVVNVGQAANEDGSPGPVYTAPPKLDPRSRPITPPFSEPGIVSPIGSPREVAPLPSTHAQAQSPLFNTLPAEIRFHIWRELLADQIVNLFLEPRPPYKLHLCACKISPEVDMRLAECTGGWLGLLQSCRRIYCETIDMIYTQNTFYTHNEFTLAYLAHKIAAPRFSTIRNVHLKAFCPSPRHTHVSGYGDLDPNMAVWGALASMPGLEHLTVEIGGREWLGPDDKWWDMTDVRAWRNAEAFYLQRLDVIKQVKDFRVIVSWPAGIHPIEAVIPLGRVERRWPPAQFWDFPRASA